MISARTRKLFFITSGITLLITAISVLVHLWTMDEEREFLQYLAESDMLLFSETGKVQLVNAPGMGAAMSRARDLDVDVAALWHQQRAPELRAKLVGLILASDPDRVLRTGVGPKGLGTTQECEVLLAALEMADLPMTLDETLAHEGWKLIAQMQFPQAQFAYAQHLFEEGNMVEGIPALWEVVHAQNSFSGSAGQFLSRVDSEATTAVNTLFEMAMECEDVDVSWHLAASLFGIVATPDDRQLFDLLQEFRIHPTPELRAAVHEALRAHKDRWIMGRDTGG